ncbi:helix-turn-helix transcriptional regulator [Pleomorphomonas sp. NRK KF1]|uniref:helix-turn-helix transcriptional regulator n=1 Tax=Pleomorphomonas sp. NRK KF1 TaxID=2943000 RepID=UPI0020430D2F|nr:helix-turn-helix transcriptional regulator [Pleomorphomonas sp. NRK KF1]MCM5554053.1 helix-turn-helix transcriptional regulator [Pleomorphomonas sp. NRK KF1]
MSDHSKALLNRPGVGFTASVAQGCDLRFSRVIVDRPTLIVVDHGSKILEAPGGSWTVAGGEGVALAGGQTFDVTNRLSDAGRYGARWLVWDPSIIASFERSGEGATVQGVAAFGRLDAGFAEVFDRAIEAIGDVDGVPEAVARHRLTEVLVWLSLQGIRFSSTESPSFATRVRRLIEGSADARWTAAEVADRLAVSEATLRRRLAAEGTTLGDLLADVRMAQGMLLLQSTDLSVNRVALEVGYESASRFAIRFRRRFGFPPTAIRGHARGAVSVG